MTNSLQFYEPGKPYTFNGFVIPSQQTLPPATAPYLAFRPACEQLQPVEQANGLTAWTVPQPVGQGVIIISEQPSGLSATQAHLYADADGACKLNGVEVPIVAAEALPKPLLPDAQVAVQVAEEVLSSEFIVGNQVYVGVGFIAIALILGAISAFSRGRNIKPGSHEDAFTKLVSLATQSSQEDER